MYIHYRSLKKDVLKAFLIPFLLISPGAIAQDGKFSFKNAVPARTSAGVYSKNGILLRTLWNDVRYPAGTFTQVWDGKDDKGIELASGDGYHVKLVTNNVKYTWEGTIGNTSDSMTGPSKHRGYYHCMQGLAFSGSYGYFCTGYSEGSPSLAKFNTRAPNKKMQFFNPKAQSGDINFVTADNQTVYWGAFDANMHQNSFVFATSIANDEEASFINGLPFTVKYGKIYKSAISIIHQRNGFITGLAVQKNGNFLLVSREGLDQLQVIDKKTGTLIKEVKVNKPRSICIDSEGNLWMVSDTNKVAKYKIEANGSLSEALLDLHGIVEPATLAFDEDKRLIVVADGGVSQQVKFFESSSGRRTDTLGTPGGYFSDASVNDNKFYFSDASGKKQSFIAFEPNGSFWVNDPGNFRVQHYGPDKKFINRIMSLGATYSTWVDKNDISRLWADYLEFSIDYSARLTGSSGWKLVKNWGATITSGYDKPEKFRYILTLSNGRTYGFLRTSKGREIVEFPAKGQLRFSGILRSGGLNFVMAKDGSLEQYTKGSLGGVSVLNKYELTGFDEHGNPLWSSLPVTLATTPVLTIDDPNAPPRSESLTSTGQVVIYAYNAVERFNNRKPEIWATGYHLGAIKKGGGGWLWKTEIATNTNYKGDFPGAGYFDIGNGVHNNAGGSVCIVDRNIITSYHGEFWKNAQTNKFNHYLDNGLAIAQFGTTRPEVIGHAAAGMAGNALTPVLIKDLAGNLFLIHGDESDHAGVHRWKITGLNTIHEQDIPLTYAGNLSRMAAKPRDLMWGLPYNASVANSNQSGWARNPESDINIHPYNDIFTVSTNVLKYDKLTSPDIFMRFAKRDPATYTVMRDLGNNKAANSWALSGFIAFPNNMPNGFSVSQFLEVLDANGKVLTKFHVQMNRSVKPFTATIYGNDKVISSGHDQAVKKAMSTFKKFEVKVVKGIVTINYGDLKAVKTMIYDGTADWRSPKTMRCRFESVNDGNVYGAAIGLKEFMFTKD